MGVKFEWGLFKVFETLGCARGLT
ncbi:hypothetical protein AGR13a_Cc30003 [Agrobacterium genomosp. 13 str. CFBP 6927]|uniref:Uncharacterized protein n=1 Tax=Agrobacterium genomosp. 13 str. CFBP 6927 TaxID=1183428 RepID=A0ABM9VFC2_9HYPH|nr:hypothetical protein AGR13a_Cc30003 [Agrobacterium genomosp. 13 str. CFBP 6927]